MASTARKKWDEVMKGIGWEDSASTDDQPISPAALKKYSPIKRGVSPSATAVQLTDDAPVAASPEKKAYYSRPELGAESESLYSEVQERENDMLVKSWALKRAQRGLEKTRGELVSYRGQLDALETSYKADPSQHNAELYNAARNTYIQMQKAYSDAETAYNAAYDAYMPTENAYKRAVGTYQRYTTAQQRQYEDWCGTIRDSAVVKQELDAVEKQLAELRTQQNVSGFGAWLSNTTRGMIAAGGGVAAAQEQGVDNSAQIAQLEQVRTLLQEEYDWGQYLRYADLMGADDFREKSQYVPTANGLDPVLNGISGTYTETGFDDLTYDYINRNEDARGKALVNSIGDNTAMLGLDKSYLQQMKDEEIGIFNYLYATQGPEAAYKYTAYLTTTLNQRQRMEQEEQWAKYAKEHPVASSAFSVLTAPAKGLSYIGQAADFIADGEIDQNAAYNKFSYANSAIRGQVAKQIEESGNWGPVGSFAYQTGMSMADFLFTTAITGGNQTLSLAVMGSGAAADTTIAAKDRGLEDWQAFTLGTVAGLAEAAMEKVSLDALLDPNLLRNGSLQYIIKNMVAEGSEEVGTDVINLFADILISQDKSEWQKSIDAYVADGKTIEEALGLAMLDQAVTMGLDFLGGAISGGIMSGGSSIAFNHNTSNLGKELGKQNLSPEDVQAFIERSLESDPGTDAYKIAKELQKKIDAGQEISNFDLSRQYQANVQVFIDLIRQYQANVQAVAQEQQTEEGAETPVGGEVTGLQLPGLEDDSQGDTADPLNTEDGVRGEVSGSVQPDSSPVSLAEQIRREQKLNGGIENVNTDERSAGPAAAQPESGAAGASVSDGGQGRYAGQSAGKQTGFVAGSTTGQRGAAEIERRRAAIDRQNRIGHLRLEKVSSQDLGLQSGTEVKSVCVIPQEHWDNELTQIAERVYKETGKNVTFVMGRIQVRGASGNIGYARGVISGENVFVQADNFQASAEQIADHEAYHAKSDFFNGTLNEQIRQHIIETFSEEQFRTVLEKYIIALRGVYNAADIKSGDEYESMVRMIEEEVFADAYAGINAFGAGADQFAEAVNERMDQLYVGKLRDQENGTEKPTGPPEERFSYAGENANNADLEALERAKEMQAAGVADETIRQETGWFVGIDGKWRWEIDDSRMKYTQRGDLGFRERNPGYVRYRELLDKSNRYALELSDEAPTEAEYAELNRLSEIWRGTFQKPGRITEDALPQDRLADYLQHDELFEAYPQLRKTTLRFADLPDGTRGQYDPSRNSITLDETLRRAPEDTLVHEIQHAIQNVEGFTPGASVEYWKEHRREITETIAAARQNLNLWLNDIGYPEKNRESILEVARKEKTMEQHWKDMSEFKANSRFAQQIAACEAEIAEYQRQYDEITGGMLPSEQYYNTAGEIEARDVTARRSLAPEQRRSQPPARGDENTVFAENGDDLSLRLGERFSMDDVDSHGHDLTQEQQAYFAQSQARDDSGRLLVLYHQTDGEFTIFDTRHAGAGSKDSDTPFGIFLKRSAGDIGLAGKKQMALYANITNPLRAANREDLIRQLREISDRYAAIADRHKQLDSEYHEKFEQAKKAWRDYITEWRAANPGANRRALNDDPKFNELFDAEDDIVDEWTAAADRLSTEAKEVITADLRRAGYDGVFLENDVGSWGRRTDAIIALDPEQVKNISNKTPTSNPDIRYSVDDVDSHGHSLTPEQQAFFTDSKVRDENGRLLPVYHGSKNSGFNVFRYSEKVQTGTDYGKAFYFTSDYEKASGYSYDAGKDPRIAEYRDNRNELMRRFLATRSEQDKNAFLNYRLNGMTARDMMDDEGYQTEGGEVKAVYLNIANPYVADANGEYYYKVYPDYFEAARKNGNDGIIVKNVIDNPRGTPRPIDVYIAFEQDQIKSTTNRRPTHNPDIRYSVDDGGQDPAQQKPKKKTQRKKQDVKPVAESKPLRSKRELRNTVLSMFSVPSEKRVELGTMIDSYADRLIKNGSLTEQDRKNFFDRMYDSGVMTVPADDFHAEARNYVKKGKIYVPESVRAEFGDDWNNFRKQAFGAGVYLTSNRADAGIDQWNTELAETLPGFFDSEDTDLRSILERIIQVAEEGKDEKVSLQEYTARLAGEGYVSEDEFLDNMERQLDWALRTFAEKASLEIDLRDRTGKKIAQEREGFAEKTAERSARQKAREAQRRADEREARKESARRARERKELRELQQKTLKQLQWLNRNRNRAPEELKAAWDEVLGDIDLYAVGAANEMRWSEKHNATWKDLAQMYKDAMQNDPNFLPSKELERIVARLDGTKIAEMDLGALQDLYKAAIGLRTEFYNRNNVINDEMNRLFGEVYTDAKREIETAPGGFTGKVLDKFLNLDQLTPMNVLQRMAGWDPNGAFYSMAKQLERGERDMRAYSVKAQKMLQDFLTEHEDWVKIADGQGKDAIWYEVEVPQLLELGMGDKPIFGPTVKVFMTPAQKVHMYLESKNLDNLRHMTGGRTFVDKELYSQGKRQEALSQGRTIRLAPETVRKLVSDLTAEEMELAKILDQYYNTFATQEINKVSNILYGYDKAMGKNYAPIYTNRNYTKTEFGVFDTTAEGVGNLKGRQYAVNPSYNISAFDAFERHVDQTARFCGMAIPARNWTTLMNWREKNNSTGDVITHKWGEESKNYIENLLITLQGGDDAKSESVSSAASKLQSNYISAVFGANPSIVLKQLGSIPLAGAYLDARNVPTPAQIAKIDRSLISKYTQELEWRTMGYTTPETKQLKDNPNWTQTNKVFKFAFGGGAITAMDGWAASTLWPWAENKVRREHPELEVGTQDQVDAGESAFYKKVAEEFENAMLRSQSVSDEIHQGTLRKSKNPITKAFTMFRSDSAQTYNALRQKIGEARYYMRIGATDKVVQSAKKAAGTAFVAMLINAAWSEAVSFLMAMWKNKGKYYRDDEDELTFQSVAGEMVSNMLGSFAGVVTFGEEVFEIIGNILTGEKIYDIETPGMEQLNDLIDAVTTAGGGMRDLVAGGWDVMKNGGNLGDYFSKHSGEMLGGIKDLAKAAAMYLPGLPVSNLEAYLMGAVKWVSPELGAAYDDLFDETGKSDLVGMEGNALEGRISRILSDRKVSESDGTAAALAALYEAGYKTAIPSDTPTSVSIDGEKHTMGDYQQQAYDTIWSGIVADALDDMVASDSFAEADPKTQAKMLSNLYAYAAERAKDELFDEYELDSGASKNADIVAAGATIAECIIWNTTTSEMKSGEKSAELASWDLPEEAKRKIFLNKISDSREESVDAFEEAGLSFDQFLQAYSKYGEINSMDLKTGQKAVEFSHWVTGQGYSDEQAVVVKDELTYFSMTPASSNRYDELVGSGMDPDDAYDLTGVLNDLQPEDGADKVSDLQQWRASVNFSDDVEDQLVALSAVMTDAQFLRVEIANDFGVTPDAYVTLQEIKPQFDADGNGAYKQTEIQAAIDGLPGYYTTEQKAVLWQLATGSTSSRNNPYSRQIGQEVLDAKAAAKKSEEPEELEGLTLGNW